MENPFTKPHPITLTKNTVEITDSLKVPYNVMVTVTEVSGHCYAKLRVALTHMLNTPREISGQR